MFFICLLILEITPNYSIVIFVLLSVCMHVCVCVRERERERTCHWCPLHRGAIYHLTCLTYISQCCVLLLLGPRNLTFPSFAFFSFLFSSSSLPPVSLFPSFLALTLKGPLSLSSSSFFFPLLSFLFYLFYLFTYSMIIYWLFYVLRKYVYYIMNKAEKMSFRQDLREISYK